MLDRETFQTSNTLGGKEFEERERIVFISLSSRECALPSYSHNERGDISIGLSEATNLFECFLSLSLSLFFLVVLRPSLRAKQGSNFVSKYIANSREISSFPSSGLQLGLVSRTVYGLHGSLVFLDFSYVLLRLELGSLKSFPR